MIHFLNDVLLFAESGIRLWERRKTDDDFLKIRIGHGQIPLSAKYAYSEERFSLDEDPLESQMYELANNKVVLKNAPILCDLIENFVCGISGSKQLAIAMIKRILTQIVMSHSYDEVKTIFLVNEADLTEMDYIRYLPHLWNNQKSFLFYHLLTNDLRVIRCEYFFYSGVKPHY